MDTAQGHPRRRQEGTAEADFRHRQRSFADLPAWTPTKTQHMTYEKPQLETYGRIDDLTESVDDGYGPGEPPPPSN